MSLLDRKRLHWLRNLLGRSPRSPIEESLPYGAAAFDPMVVKERGLEDDFLWGVPSDRREPEVLRLPKDVLLANALMTVNSREPREGEVRSSITYDPEAATKRLLGLIKGDTHV